MPSDDGAANKHRRGQCTQTGVHEVDGAPATTSGCLASRSSSHSTNAGDCQRMCRTTLMKQLNAPVGFRKCGSARPGTTPLCGWSAAGRPSCCRHTGRREHLPTARQASACQTHDLYEQRSHARGAVLVCLSKIRCCTPGGQLLAARRSPAPGAAGPAPPSDPWSPAPEHATVPPSPASPPVKQKFGQPKVLSHGE